jgi:hypothetical protein
LLAIVAKLAIVDITFKPVSNLWLIKKMNFKVEIWNRMGDRKVSLEQLLWLFSVVQSNSIIFSHSCQRISAIVFGNSPHGKL